MREKLIEMLNKSFAEQYDKRGLLTAPHTADFLIANGVTIDPSTLRPKGEWLEKKLDNFRMLEAKCSECGWTGIENYDAYIDPFDFNFCPNCGADMRGGADGDTDARCTLP